jgi:hypothetical protein
VAETPVPKGGSIGKLASLPTSPSRRTCCVSRKRAVAVAALPWRPATRGCSGEPWGFDNNPSRVTLPVGTAPAVDAGLLPRAKTFFKAHKSERLVFERPYGLNERMASAADDALACPACGYDMRCVRLVRRWPQDRIGVFRCERCNTQVSRLAHRTSARTGAAQRGAEKISARA